MAGKSNRIFKELIEKVYQKRFENKVFNDKELDNIKLIPNFYYSEKNKNIVIEIKEGESIKNSSQLENFYNNLQNINKIKSSEVILDISCDEKMYKKIVSKYIDIFHFIDKVNTKYYTKKFFKEKILVELQALEDILEYSIKNDLQIKMNNNNIDIINKNLEVKFNLQLEDEHFYLKLEQNIDDFYNIIYTNNYIYIYYKDKIYRCNSTFKDNVYIILEVFLKNYINKIHIYKNNLTNFFSLIYPTIKSNINIEKEIFEAVKKYIPEILKIKLYLDFDNRNYLIANVIFDYAGVELNPLENIKNEIKRNVLEESIFLNKLIKSGFMLDEKNKRLIINNDEIIYNFINSEIQEYMNIATVYSTENFKKKKIHKKDSTQIAIKVKNNLLEINFDKISVDKSELKEILQKYKLNKKFYRLKDGTFLDLEENEEIKVINEIYEGLDVAYKNIDDTLTIPINRTMYLNKLLSNNKNVNLKVDDEYNNILNTMNKRLSENEIPNEIKNNLRDYQIEGFLWLNSLDQFKFGGILADDMGLGKTIQALMIILYNKIKSNKVEPSLIVVPSSLTLNWKSEAEKFANKLETLIITGNAEERNEKIKKINEYDLVITSYDTLKRDIEEYEKLNLEFRYIIADEAQYIKNNSTQNSKALKRINAQTKFALTGTPIENSLSELWSIFDFIMPSYLYTYKKFKTYFELPIVKNNDNEVLEKLKMIIEPFVLRRTKSQVLNELPDKEIIVLNNEMDEEQEKIYVSYLMKARNELNDEIDEKGFEQSRIKILALLTRLRQICCHPSLFISDYKYGSGKLNQCIELVKDGIQSGHKILLFSGYTSMFDILEPELKEEGINYLKLAGSTKVKERFEIIEKFNKEDDTKLFLISLKAGGTGINLTSADMVIHYDPWWNISVENQATDRAHRIGQTKKVQVYKLITQNSIEEKIYDLQQRKKALIDNMLSTDVKFINTLSKDDILKLFE